MCTSLSTYLPLRRNFSAQDMIVGVVQPLLELLREYTGFYLTLIAGVPLLSGEQEFKIKM